MDKLPRNYRAHTNKYICHIYTINMLHMCRWSMRVCALRREFAANWKCHGNGKQSPRRGAAPVAWNAWNGRQLKRVRCRTMWQSSRPASAEPQRGLRVEPELAECAIGVREIARQWSHWQVSHLAFALQEIYVFEGRVAIDGERLRRMCCKIDWYKDISEDSHTDRRSRQNVQRKWLTDKHTDWQTGRQTYTIKYLQTEFNEHPDWDIHSNKDRQTNEKTATDK